MEFRNLVASGKLSFALQTVIFLHTLISLNTYSPGYGTMPQLSVLHDPTQSSVYINKLTLPT